MTADVAVVTLCSTPRMAHLRGQLASLERADAQRIVVWIGEDDPPVLAADRVLRVPPGENGLRLAAARNTGADAAMSSGAGLLVFLDADCVAGSHLVARYLSAAVARPGAVLCGPVTYLPPGIDVSDDAALRGARAPHPARPNPPDGDVLLAGPDEYRLFWSLSFALTPATWQHVGGFDPGYEGYGAEDTDFGFAMRAAGVPLAWVGGAHAYHQHHETQSPPWAHLDDILRNGERFARRWGQWPMTGWLEAFAEAGAIVWDGQVWRRTPASWVS